MDNWSSIVVFITRQGGLDYFVGIPIIEDNGYVPPRGSNEESILAHRICYEHRGTFFGIVPIIFDFVNPTHVIKLREERVESVRRLARYIHQEIGSHKTLFGWVSIEALGHVVIHPPHFSKDEAITLSSNNANFWVGQKIGDVEDLIRAISILFGIVADLTALKVEDGGTQEDVERILHHFENERGLKDHGSKK
jgi:hypothetical protein